MKIFTATFSLLFAASVLASGGAPAHRYSPADAGKFSCDAHGYWRDGSVLHQQSCVGGAEETLEEAQKDVLRLCDLSFGHPLNYADLDGCYLINDQGDGVPAAF